MDTTIEDVIAGCVVFACMILLMLVFGGCASPQIKPALANADGDVQAVKVGEVLPVRGSAELTADVKPVVGVGNTVSTERTSVGGNMTISNDGEVFEATLVTYQALTEKYIDLMWKIVYALMGAFGSALSAIIGMLWFMLRSDKERDIRFEKQEAKHVR